MLSSDSHILVKMLSLREYGSDDSSGDSNEEDAFLHLKPKATDTSLSIVVASAPGVVSTVNLTISSTAIVI